MDTLNISGFAPGFFVDISEHLQLKTRMLACHNSQLQGGDDPDFSPMADLLRLQAQTRGSQAGVTAAEAFRAYHGFKVLLRSACVAAKSRTAAGFRRFRVAGRRKLGGSGN